MTPDVIIVGSGTSGGVIACYLTLAGARCLLLEAGHHYTAETFPENEMDYSARLFWNGGLELNTDADLAFLRGLCLGGGSVVNQCLLDHFDDLAWADWAAASGVPFFTAEAMAPHYRAIEDRLSIQEIPPRQHNRNARIMVEGFAKLGHRWAALHRGQSDCRIDEGNDCMACLGGCHRDSKQSTLVTFLSWARLAGLEIWTGFRAERLEVSRDRVRVLGVHDGQQCEVSAPRAVLAGGAFGTTGLLLRSGLQSRLPALGRGFFCHPQHMVFALFDEPVDAHKGAFQAIKSDDPAFRRQGFKLENVFAGPIGLAMLLPGFGPRHRALMERYRYLACMEVAVRDVTPGTLRVTRAGGLVIRKRLGTEDQRRLQAGIEVIREIFRVAGAREVIVSPVGLGFHLMGGCAIGSDPTRAVVNDRFQVHGFPHLFAADSSIFPAAPGINPALTIMALSHRASVGMLAS